MIRLFLFASVALGIVLLLYVGRMFVLASRGAKLVADSRRFERLNGGNPLILVVGDSTGVGTGVRDALGSVAGRLATDFPTAEVLNLSVNGWRVRNALEAFPATAPKHYDLVLLQIGANDILRRTPMKDFDRDLSSLFDRARSAGKNVVALHSGNIGLAPFFLWPLSSYYRSKTLQYREIYRRIAEEKGVLYVDLFREKSNDPFKDSQEYYAPDLLHLTEKGYGNWYESIREAMTNADIRL
jgi:lysophospholipase L1-like esterase